MATLHQGTLLLPFCLTTVAHFLSLSHFGSSCNISNVFIIIILNSMVSCDQGTCFEVPGATNYIHIQWQSLSINVWSDFSTTKPFPVSFLILGLPYSMRHKNIEIRPINNPTMASNSMCSSERMSFTLN